jgi:tetratricopeptide (TPR) repeat protein
MNLEERRKRKEAEEFVRWLAPSHQLVEAQLRTVRKQRQEGTLEWARTMPEFHAWRTSSLKSAERVLWIQGTLGVGKSTMAGYLIELLKYSTPAPAIVAFFFCRSNQRGLTKASEIIRTIAYQCFFNNPTARMVLEEKKSINYLTDETVAIDPLFENLIGEPLRLIQQEIYFVIDGLDESDTEAMDEHGSRVPKSEMRVLVECFINLPSARVLFISRPTPTIFDGSKPAQIVIKRIGKDDNSYDIDSYVKLTVSDSRQLQSRFQALNVEPRDYFRQHANSVFLWVVIVLAQLEKTKGKKDFEKTLNEFTESGGAEIDKVYGSMFQKVAEDDQEFVKEVLRWEIYDQFNVARLRGAVEWSLDDDFGDGFENLLEVHCGPMFHAADSDAPLQLIHETLRSYITVRAKRDAFYFVDEDKLKIDALVTILDVLTELERSKNERFSAFRSYALYSWVDQLKKVTDSKLASPEIAQKLYKFLQSDACKYWVKHALSSTSEFLFSEYENNPFLETLAKGSYNVYHFLVLWNSKRKATVAPEDAVSRWALEMLECPAKLGEYVGKVCTDVLFNDEVAENAVRPLFLSTIHYYCMRHKLNRCSIVDVLQIAKNGCSALFDWIGKANDNPASAKYLGLVLSMLQSWEEAEPWFRQAREYEKSTRDTTGDMARSSHDIIDEGFVRACLRKENYMDVIDTVGSRNGTALKWDVYRAIAFNAMGNSQGAEEVFKIAMDERRHSSGNPSTEWLAIQLLQIYIPQRDWDKVISVCTDLLDDDPSIWWAWDMVKAAYSAKDDTTAIKEVRGRQSRSYPDYEKDESAGLPNKGLFLGLVHQLTRRR